MNYFELILFLPLIVTLFLLAFSYPFKWLHLKEEIVKHLFDMSAFISIVFSLVGILFSFEQETVLFNFIPLKVDLSNLLIYFFSSIMLFLVSKFSFKYIHKELGFYKFFLNLILFWLGQFLFVFADDYLVLFSGWEFIGISSLFLISFYSFRESPIKNSLYVMSFYKIADIILITCLILLGHKEILDLHPNYLQIVYSGIIIAGLVKSAAFPFSSWLPRSMEGPTTSSAIYYVALSVNTGVILIYKFLPQLNVYDLCNGILFVCGALTVIYSTFVSRVQTDAKTSLGYSSLIQIGIILIECSFGLTTLAIVHLFLNSFYKLYQFIKSPSLLTSYHTMIGENQSLFGRGGKHFESFVPEGLRKSLYFYSLNGFYLDHFYLRVGRFFSILSSYVEQLFFPLINKTSKHSYRTMFWWAYYILLAFLISAGAIDISNNYFDIIPFVILLVSISLLFEKNQNAFIAMLMIYKILESFIVHGVHSHEPYKWIAIIILGLFLFLLIFSEKRKIRSKSMKHLTGTLLIFLMLYFTNLPFLLQSLVNEHIIEAFLIRDKVVDLVFYSFANTFLNIALYLFIFNKIYFKEIIDE